MTAGTKRMLITYEDLQDLPDDLNRYEILEGELAVTPAPSTGHQGAAGNLYVILYTHIRRYGLGKVLFAPCDVLLDAVTVVEPDLLFVGRERLGIIQPKYVQGPPDLVVEVLSPTTAQRDRGVKSKLYARFGVPYVWLVEPTDRELSAFALEAGAYREVAAGREDESFSAPPFADLVIPLAEVWP